MSVKKFVYWLHDLFEPEGQKRRNFKNLKSVKNLEYLTPSLFKNSFLFPRYVNSPTYTMIWT